MCAQLQATIILNGCSGSVLAIAAAGTYLFLNQTTPGAWDVACQQLPYIFSDQDVQAYRTQVSTFGASQLVLSGLGAEARAAFWCLEPLRAGVDIPLELVRLAICEGLATGMRLRRGVDFNINELVKAGLVRQDHSGSRLYILELISMFLTRREEHYQPTSNWLFAGPAVPRRELLAAFIVSFGHDTAAAAADAYLQAALPCNASIISSELSKHWQAAEKLANQIAQPGSIAASKVAAAVVTWRAWAKAGARREELPAALGDAQLAVSLHGDTFALQALAGIERRLGQYDAALEHLNQALQQQPNDMLLHHTRNCIMVSLGEGNTVLTELSQALERELLVPGSQARCAGLLTARGDIKRRMGSDLKGALEDLNEADTLCPGNDYSLTVRGDVLRILASKESNSKLATSLYLMALDDLNAAAQLQGGGQQLKALTSQARGVVKWRLATFSHPLGDLLGAREDLINSRQAYDDADIHIFLAAVQHALGNDKCAKEEYRQAAQIINLPGNSFVPDSRGLFEQLTAQLHNGPAAITVVAY